MESKLKHLEFIQSAINRMANNSFLLKGWSVTIVGALLALSFKEMHYLYVVISLAVVVFFWVLDGYYLSQEKAFIGLYNHARTVKGGDTDFSMDTSQFRHNISWVGCTLSKTVTLFYGGLLVVHFIIVLIL